MVKNKMKPGQIYNEKWVKNQMKPGQIYNEKKNKYRQ